MCETFLYALFFSLCEEEQSLEDLYEEGTLCGSLSLTSANDGTKLSAFFLGQLSGPFL